MSRPSMPRPDALFVPIGTPREERESRIEAEIAHVGERVRRVAEAIQVYLTAAAQKGEW